MFLIFEVFEGSLAIDGFLPEVDFFWQFGLESFDKPMELEIVFENELGQAGTKCYQRDIARDLFADPPVLHLDSDLFTSGFESSSMHLG